MNRRYRIYVGAIALLAAVNVGRWMLHGEAGEHAVSGQTMLAEDFRLRVDVPAPADHERDLFARAGGAPGEYRRGGGVGVRKRLAVRPVVKMAPLAPVSAPDAAEVMAQSGLGRLRLLGVVFHAGKRQAYLAQDKQNCIAATGDTVFGQYAVDEITVDAVQLRDTNTNMTRRIPISGK